MQSNSRLTTGVIIAFACLASSSCAGTESSRGEDFVEEVDAISKRKTISYIMQAPNPEGTLVGELKFSCSPGSDVFQVAVTSYGAPNADGRMDGVALRRVGDFPPEIPMRWGQWQAPGNALGLGQLFANLIPEFNNRYVVNIFDVVNARIKQQEALVAHGKALDSAVKARADLDSAISLAFEKIKAIPHSEVSELYAMYNENPEVKAYFDLQALADSSGIPTMGVDLGLLTLGDTTTCAYKDASCQKQRTQRLLDENRKSYGDLVGQSPWAVLKGLEPDWAFGYTALTGKNTLQVDSKPIASLLSKCGH